MITVADANGPVEMSTLQAVIRKVAVSALKGDVRSQRLLLESAQEADRERIKDKDAVLKAAMEYKTGWGSAFEECERLGRPLPAPQIHPDDVHIDTITGEVTILASRNDDEEAAAEWAKETLKWCELDIAEGEKQLARKPKPPRRQTYLEELEHAKIVRDLLEEAIKAGPTSTLSLQRRLTKH